MINSRLKIEFNLCKDSQGRVLTADERMLALTHIVQQEFIIDNHSFPNLVPLGKIIDWSVVEGERFKALSPDLRRSILMAVSTYGLIFFTNPQGVGIADATKQHWINRVSAIADKVEKGVSVSGGVRLPFYALRDALFSRYSNFIVGFGTQEDQLHSKVLADLNKTNILMQARLKGAYEELDGAFRISRLTTKLNTYRTEPDGFNQANQLKMVEMLFKFYQGLTFED